VCGCLTWAGPARADAVTDWNATTLEVLVAGAATRPTPTGILDIAMVHIAVHDAIQAFQQRFESYNAPIIGASGSPVAAAAKAARDVLVKRFAAQASSLYLNSQH